VEGDKHHTTSRIFNSYLNPRPPCAGRPPPYDPEHKAK